MVLTVGTIQYSKRQDCFVDLSRDIVQSLNGGVVVSMILHATSLLGKGTYLLRKIRSLPHCLFVILD